MKHYKVLVGFSARAFVGTEGQIVSLDELTSSAVIDKDQVALLVGMGRLEEVEAPAVEEGTKGKKPAPSLPGA